MESVKLKSESGGSFKFHIYVLVIIAGFSLVDSYVKNEKFTLNPSKRSYESTKVFGGYKYNVDKETIYSHKKLDICGEDVLILQRTPAGKNYVIKQEKVDFPNLVVYR